MWVRSIIFGQIRIYGITDEPNIAPVRLLEKLGMQFEEKTGTLELPTLVYSINKPVIAEP
jgi:RimJ/RimL family protein N-acetyltransferase